MSQIELSTSDVRRLNWFGVKPFIAKVLGSSPLNPAVQLAGRTILPQRIASRLPLNRRKVEYRLNDGASVELLDPLHDTVARDIYWGSGKPISSAERHKLSVFESLSKDAALFLDIGAYAGLFALIAARANGDLKAVAFEIVPENYLLLLRNIIANDLVGRIEARLCGLGAAHSTLVMPAQFGAASYLSSISLGSKFEQGVAIPVAPLDDQLEEVRGSVLMKIDVEGFEAQVFRGGEKFIRAHRPDIICEILPGADESCRLITDLLEPLGYRWYSFEDSGLTHQENLAPQSVMRDWLFRSRADLPAGLPLSPR